MPIIADPDAIWLGLDVHKDTISVGALEPGCEVAVVGKIFHDEPSVRRLIGRFGDRSRLRCVTRPARPARSWPACCSGWACPVTWSHHR